MLSLREFKRNKKKKNMKYNKVIFLRMHKFYLNYYKNQHSSFSYDISFD